MLTSFMLASNLLARSLGSLPVEKLDPNSRPSARNIFPLDVSDPAGKDSFTGQYLCYRPWHPQNYLERLPHKNWMARHKVNSSWRHVYGFCLVTIRVCQRSVYRTRHRRTFWPVAVCVMTFERGHGCRFSAVANLVWPTVLLVVAPYWVRANGAQHLPSNGE